MKRASVSNIVAVLLALYIGRCSAPDPYEYDALAICSSLNPEAP